MLNYEKLRESLMELGINELNTLRSAFSSEKKCTQTIGFKKTLEKVEFFEPDNAENFEIIAIANALKVSPHHIISEYGLGTRCHPLLLEHFEKSNDYAKSQ